MILKRLSEAEDQGLFFYSTVKYGRAKDVLLLMLLFSHIQFALTHINGVNSLTNETLLT